MQVKQSKRNDFKRVLHERLNVEIETKLDEDMKKVDEQVQDLVKKID